MVWVFYFLPSDFINPWNCHLFLPFEFFFSMQLRMICSQHRLPITGPLLSTLMSRCDDEKNGQIRSVTAPSPNFLSFSASKFLRTLIIFGEWRNTFALSPLIILREMLNVISNFWCVFYHIISNVQFCNMIWCLPPGLSNACRMYMYICRAPHSPF